MNSRFLMVLHVFLVLFMCLSPFQLVASNHQFGNVSIKCIERERQALLALKQGFLLNRKDWLSSWGSGENETECCNWERVQCSSKTGHVLKLDLHAEIEEPYYLCDGKTINSSAFLSLTSLAELHHLKYLDLSHNSFYLNPYIPNFIGSLAHLRYLNLSYCCFEGKIPNELGNLIFLEYLDLGWNNFNGTISPQLANLSLLRYIDLSVNDFSGGVPPQLGNLLSLKYLDLGWNNFTGIIPHHLGNLSNLQHLDLSGRGSLRSDLRWVSHLSSLRHLAFNDVNLSSANNWHRLVSGLSRLQHLDLSSCDLFDSMPSSLSSVANFSTSLSYVDLSDNNLMNASLIFPWLINSTSSLATLSLDYNRLSGTIPEAIRNFSSLKQLGLAGNLLEGQIPMSLFPICSLSELDLSDNRLTGQLHEFVQAFSRCVLKLIQSLRLGWNEITGSVPDLSQLSSLERLDLDSSRLNGTINEGIGQLSNLVSLILRNNSLQGTISEAHFSRLSKLEILDLSHNPLVFNISTEWVPPFNLSRISLASCSLGPHFPSWLQNQKKIEILDISSARISDTVPNWFWNLSVKMGNLNLSHNRLRGQIVNLPLVDLSQPTTYDMDLSSNLFQGAIPAFLSRMGRLDLSYNMFSMANHFLCANMDNNLTFLDLSNNNLKGELPDCWINFKSLIFLDLSNNSFYGNLPKYLGSLEQIQALHLGSNNFSGEIPLSMNKCKQLEIFEAGQNNLSGPLPSWIADGLPKLLVLSLRFNKFHGRVPFSICHLVELRLLDLSLNNISGNLPKCIYNLSAMASQANSNVTITYNYDIPDGFNVGGSTLYDDSAALIWKGKMSKFTSTLGLLRSIDFSSNRLIGKIPSELMSLVGLVSLNLSRNMLSGEIPPTIGRLKLLDSLDLSRNHLSGGIPSQLAQLGGLGVLDLSYNDLSGEIPRSTPLQSRDASAYIGNPKLCGSPLNETCPIYGHQIDRNDAFDDQFFSMGFYIAMAIGFVVGFWGVCFSLILKKSWRYAYFKFLIDVYDKLYVFVPIKIAELQRIRSKI